MKAPDVALSVDWSGGTMKIAAVIPPELPRFAVVITAGLGVDLGTGFCVASFAALPLSTSAALGFIAGAMFNYLLHELWTFRASSTTLSSTRAGLYLMSSLVTLGVRVLIATILSPLAVNRLTSFAVLIAAAGTSFFVNFALSRSVVYRRQGEDGSPSGSE